MPSLVSAVSCVSDDGSEPDRRFCDNSSCLNGAGSSGGTEPLMAFPLTSRPVSDVMAVKLDGSVPVSLLFAALKNLHNARETTRSRLTCCGMARCVR